MVDSNDEDWGVILWWGREDNLLGSSLDVEISLLLGEENTGGLTNVVRSRGTPSDLAWVSLVVDLNELTVNGDTSIGLLDLKWESSVN